LEADSPSSTAGAAADLPLAEDGEHDRRIGRRECGTDHRRQRPGEAERPVANSAMRKAVPNVDDAEDVISTADERNRRQPMRRRRRGSRSAPQRRSATPPRSRARRSSRSVAGDRRHDEEDRRAGDRDDRADLVREDGTEQAAGDDQDDDGEIEDLTHGCR
jgi:hypothetical protein